MKRLSPGRVLLYTTLLIGALVFSFPFIWMASSSVKVDRELYTDELRIRPLTPSASPVSPWIDTQYYTDLPGAAQRQDEVLPELQKLTAPKIKPADGIDPSELATQVARGVYQRLSRMLPATAWDGTPAELVEAARPLVSQDLIDSVAGNVVRRLAIGPLRLGLDDDSEIEPNHATPIAERWQNRSPKVVSLTDEKNTGRRPSASVTYDFKSGDSFQLNSELKLPAEAKRVSKVRLAIHPDDSWHSMTLVVERDGQRWESTRDVPLSNFDWQTLTWQWPSDEDTSLKVHNWVKLQPAGRSDVSEPNALRVSLTVHQASPAKAWWNKTRLNYDRVSDSIPFFRYLRVSLFLVAANLVLTLFTSSFVAYAFTRLNWPGREACFVLMLATMMIPGQVLMIPHFLIWKTAGQFDTLTPLWLPALFGNAFYIFMLRQFIRGIPPDLEEAARIDGCNFLGIYWHVILPLIKPSLAAIAIFTFMASWNDFFGPLLYIADQRLYPLAFGLYALAVEVQNSPTITMAAGVLMTVPVIVIFFAAQRYFVQGITLTGMK
ncbi:MAG: ABC transporter permease subunit [Tepidisphaeraceae bacterium]